MKFLHVLSPSVVICLDPPIVDRPLHYCDLTVRSVKTFLIVTRIFLVAALFYKPFMHAPHGEAQLRKIARYSGG